MWSFCAPRRAPPSQLVLIYAYIVALMPESTNRNTPTFHIREQKRVDFDLSSNKQKMKMWNSHLSIGSVICSLSIERTRNIRVSRWPLLREALNGAEAKLLIVARVEMLWMHMLWPVMFNLRMKTNKTNEIQNSHTRLTWPNWLGSTRIHMHETLDQDSKYQF